MTGNRAWSARAQFANLAEFTFGTVMLPLDARLDEIEIALAARWNEIFPVAPDRITPIAGIVWFEESAS